MTKDEKTEIVQAVIAELDRKAMNLDIQQSIILSRLLRKIESETRDVTSPEPHSCP